MKTKEDYLSRRKFDDDGNVVEKRCSKCNVFKSVNDYYKDKKVEDGLYNYCKDCFKEMNKEKYQKENNKIEYKTTQSDLESFVNNEDIIGSGSLDDMIDDFSKNRGDYD